MTTKTYTLSSFSAHRRGEWHIKISVMRGNVLIVAQHAYEADNCIVRGYGDKTKAIDFMNELIGKYDD